MEQSKQIILDVLDTTAPRTLGAIMGATGLHRSTVLDALKELDAEKLVDFDGIKATKRNAPMEQLALDLETISNADMNRKGTVEAVNQLEENSNNAEVVALCANVKYKLYAIHWNSKKGVTSILLNAVNKALESVENHKAFAAGYEWKNNELVTRSTGVTVASYTNEGGYFQSRGVMNAFFIHTIKERILKLVLETQPDQAAIEEALKCPEMIALVDHLNEAEAVVLANLKEGEEVTIKELSMRSGVSEGVISEGVIISEKLTFKNGLVALALLASGAATASTLEVSPLATWYGSSTVMPDGEISIMAQLLGDTITIDKLVASCEVKDTWEDEIKVNGETVTVTAYCYNDRVISYFPDSYKSDQYLKSQFEQFNTIFIDDSYVLAHGFKAIL